MITKSTLTLLYDYHYWMNAQLLEVCAALTPGQWDQPQGHSWGSVHGTLAHMLAAETIWLRRWQGESPRALRRAEEFPTLADLRREWSALEREVRAFIAGCDEARLNASLHYTTTRGEPFTNGLGELMLHVANHGTHHRGELAAMLAVLGIPHPEDDLIRYLRERAGPA